MRAIIYCRVSSDQTGKAKSVADQERECRAVCERNNWTVAEVLVDNDRGASRWSTKDRPAYQRLSDVLKSGDVLVLWEASRASRDLAAYVLLRDLCATRGVKWCVSGKLLDPNSGDDRFGSGLDALLAEREAEQIRERVLRGKRSAALEGRPNGRLPYGYRRQFNPDTGKTERWVHDPVTAPIVSEIVTRFLGGESLFSVARDLEAREIPPPTAGVPWRAQRIRTMISSPTYAGLRVQRGEVVGKGQWDALFSEETHHRILGICADPARRVTDGRNDVKHLLTGIAVCGVCGATMRYFGPKSLKSPTYQCSENSCVRRRVSYVDEYVEATMVALLETREITHVDSAGNAALIAEMDRQRQRLDFYVQQVADEKISDESFQKLERAIGAKIDALSAKLQRVETSALTARICGPDALEHWEKLPIADKRQAIREHITITIKKSSVGTRQFSTDDVEVLPISAT